MIDKLNALLDRYRELDESIAQPEVIRDFEKYQQLLKERASLQPVVEKFTQYLSVSRQIEDAKELLSDPDLAAEAESEIAGLTESLRSMTEELKIMLVPPDPMDSRNVILEIRAGVGGEEAALFSADLLRMYLKYADRNSLSAEILSLSDSDLGGINEALLMITGPDAFARMKFESGVHCVKRVPVTESSGRIHTSTVTVAVCSTGSSIASESVQLMARQIVSSTSSSVIVYTPGIRSSRTTLP